MDPLNRLKELNTRDCLWIYVLKILADDKAHAYRLRKDIQEQFGFLPGIMTAYKVLYLLKKEGYVRTTREGRKKIYAISPKGRAELKKAACFYRNLAATLSSEGL